MSATGMLTRGACVRWRRSWARLGTLVVAGVGIPPPAAALSCSGTLTLSGFADDLATARWVPPSTSSWASSTCLQRTHHRMSCDKSGA